MSDYRMSFRNTKTPTRGDITGPAIHQVPTRVVNGKKSFYLDDVTKAHFIRLYPNTMNRDMMRMFGISFTTLQRFKRELGLFKNMKTIRHKQAQLVKKICEENGYYESMRGHAPTRQCYIAASAKRETGWHPLDEVKKNSNRYRNMMRRWSEKRKELERRERIRVNNGIDQLTNLHRPYDVYSKKVINFRNCCKLVGYILGSPFNPDERWVIYYNDYTTRGTLREQHGTKYGFTFKPQQETAPV